MLCSRIVSPWDIEKHGSCGHCAGTRIQPTNLGLLEKLVQLIKHPLIWEWDKHELVPANEEGPEVVSEDVGSDTDSVQG
jgi:hypothetical protein